MKSNKKFLLFLFMINICICIGRMSYAQPDIPEESIPSDIPKDVKQQIERLYSPAPQERSSAADTLGGRGKQAIPAIPFLIGMLGDGLSEMPESPVPPLFGIPGFHAAMALARIGEPAVEPLISALKDSSVYIRRMAAVAHLVS